MNFQDIFRKMMKCRLFVIGFTGFIIILLLCLLGPFFIKWDPLKMSLAERLVAPEFFARGLDGHILGTDALGRDVLARLLAGGRASLLISCSVVIISSLLGTTVGVISSYYSGWVDRILQRISEILMAVPALILAICIVAVIGANFINLILVLSIASWVSYSRIVRATGLSIRNSEYIQAAKVVGASNALIMAVEFLPNLFTPIIIQSTQRFGTTILIEASLSYLGMGVPVPTPSWGTMISEGREYLTTSPWVVVVPGIALMLTVLCFNFLGDGLRDVFDPRNKD
jgi:ABC-type dipeptide/oligopeptide/nickel transport system permease subunit